MATRGFEAATLARVVEESGIPMSSVYHYFGSKDRILLAVMERGADRFFADLPDLSRRPGRPAQHLARVASAATRTLERHPDFLRMLIVFAAQPPATGDGEIQAVVRRVRDHALELLRAQITAAFGDDPRSPAHRPARAVRAGRHRRRIRGLPDRSRSHARGASPAARSLARRRPASAARQRGPLLAKEGPASRRCPPRCAAASSGCTRRCWPVPSRIGHVRVAGTESRRLAAAGSRVAALVEGNHVEGRCPSLTVVRFSGASAPSRVASLRQQRRALTGPSPAR